MELLIITTNDRDHYSVDNTKVQGRETLSPDGFVVYPLSVLQHVSERMGVQPESVPRVDSSEITFPPDPE